MRRAEAPRGSAGQPLPSLPAGKLVQQTGMCQEENGQEMLNYDPPGPPWASRPLTSAAR